jgi:hypothetical protein
VARLGLVSTSRNFAFTHRAVADFVARRQGDLALTREVSTELANALREGRLDLSLLYERTLDSATFDERLIQVERYVLAVHPSHAMADRKPFAFPDLAGVPIVWLARQGGTDQDRLMQQFQAAGIEPLISHLARTKDEQIDLTFVSGGLCLTPAATMLSCAPGSFVFRPVLSLPLEVTLRLVWRRSLEEGSAAGLLECFHRAIDEHQAAIAGDTFAWTHLHGEQVAAVAGFA